MIFCTTGDVYADYLTDIYNMSPNREQFSEFRAIEPKGVKVADKTIFMATGVGCMKIDIPNGRDSTTVMLKDMLYCPDLGYM